VRAAPSLAILTAGLTIALVAGSCSHGRVRQDEPVANEAPVAPDGFRLHDSPMFSDQGDPTLVTPRPGMAGVRPHAFAAAMEHADGRGVRVAFWGGVAPCFVLDRVEVREAWDSVAITLYAGSDPSAPDAACIEIALLMATDVALSSPLAGRPVVDGADGVTKSSPH
jgi:hypothetical protein